MSLFVLLVTLATWAGAAQDNTPRIVELSGAACIACPETIDGPGIELVYRGRTVRAHEGKCAEAWSADTERLFAQLQPKGALFNESADVPAEMKTGWLAFGVYVLIGLVFGAASAYVAINRGHNAAAWFFLGLAFNVLALIALLMRGSAAPEGAPAGVPEGLSKVPVTHAPLRCSGCGAQNHPSAVRCPECDAELRPAVESETGKIR